jgi:polyphenol oxidase
VRGLSLISATGLGATVQGFCTTREHGVSQAPLNSLNLGQHVGDDPAAVAQNRAKLRQLLPSEPIWLQQVHGTEVLDLDAHHAAVSGAAPIADAAFTRTKGRVVAIMTADCLPVLLSAPDGSVVGGAHAGWRGLNAGVLEALVEAMQTKQLRAWLGPAIGPHAFEVGAEVRQAFLANDLSANQAFLASGGRAADGSPRYFADLYQLARLRLKRVGVEHIAGGEHCTLTNATKFFSHRRDGRSGRMASCIWIGA